MSVNHLATFVAYMRAYEARDLEALAAMLSDTVRLRDWKISAVGIDEVLAQTRQNFDAARSIEIEVLATYQNDAAVAGELKVTVNGCQEIRVVDVLRFDDVHRCRSIHAVSWVPPTGSGATLTHATRGADPSGIRHPLPCCRRLAQHHRRPRASVSDFCAAPAANCARDRPGAISVLSIRTHHDHRRTSTGSPSTDWACANASSISASCKCR